MTEKKKKLNKKLSIEELYQNKNFVPPKEKNLETIFEEPRKAKNGAPILTSVKKYKRYLHFDPTEGKIHKRKLKAKKCVNKMKALKRTRSASKKSECNDISLYILQAIGESSDSEMEQTGTDAPDSCAAYAPSDSKVDIAQPNAIVEFDSSTLQNPDGILSDIEIKKTNDSQKCEDIVETESAADTVPEDTVPETPSRSSCIMA